ncbi:hypothetical protein ACH5RR_002370 [Cinchona calisaya]|uniref:Uncharacterized protein n=1 Tax=Cinchona calisaya TaxID=153742 RepID=A0ABD3B6D2_9GENT
MTNQRHWIIIQKRSQENANLDTKLKLGGEFLQCFSRGQCFAKEKAERLKKQANNPPGTKETCASHQLKIKPLMLASLDFRKEHSYVLKRRFPDQAQHDKESIGSEKRKKTKRNNDPLGQDVVDKLDTTLIEQYKSKFMGHNLDLTGQDKQGSKQIRRWFQS